MSIKLQLQAAMKDAMRAKAKERLSTIRLIQAEVKQQEKDLLIELSQEQLLAILSKMVKQRREAIDQFSKANRQDLVDKETAELQVVQEFLPQALSRQQLVLIVDEAISETQASSVRDISKVMTIVKPKIVGKADLSEVGKLIKDKLSK